MMGAGTYVNALGGDEVDRIEATYGAKYQRLAAVKAAYDPQNVFCGNLNIPPQAIPPQRSAPGGS